MLVEGDVEFGYLFAICEVVTEGQERICRVIRSMEAVPQLVLAPKIFLLFGFRALSAFLFQPILNCWTASMILFIFSMLRLRNHPPSIRFRQIRGPFLKVAIASSAAERIRSLLLWE